MPRSPSQIAWDQFIIFSPVASPPPMEVTDPRDEIWIPSPLLSETDYGDSRELARKYKELLTYKEQLLFELPSEEICFKIGLKMPGAFWQSLGTSRQTPSGATPIPPSINHSWSDESLGVILSGIPNFFNIGGIASTVISREPSILEAFVVAVMNHLLGPNQFGQLLQWLPSSRQSLLVNTVLANSDAHFPDSLLQMLLDNFYHCPPHIRAAATAVLEDIIIQRVKKGFHGHLLNMTLQKMISSCSLGFIEFILTQEADCTFRSARLASSAIVAAFRRGDRPIIRRLLRGIVDRDINELSWHFNPYPPPILFRLATPGRRSLFLWSLALDLELDADSLDTESLTLFLADNGADLSTELLASLDTFEWCSIVFPRLYDSLCRRQPPAKASTTALIGRTAHYGLEELRSCISKHRFTSSDLQKTLTFAAFLDTPKIVHLLLEAGVDPNFALETPLPAPAGDDSPVSVNSPLLASIASLSTESTKYLLRHGALLATSEIQKVHQFLLRHERSGNVTDELVSVLAEMEQLVSVAIIFAVYMGDPGLATRLIAKHGPDHDLSPTIFGHGDYGRFCTPLQAGLISLRKSTPKPQVLWDMGCKFSKHPNHRQGSYELALACNAFVFGGDADMLRLIQTFLNNGVSDNDHASSIIQGSFGVSVNVQERQLMEKRVIKLYRMIRVNGFALNRVKVYPHSSIWMYSSTLAMFCHLNGTPIQHACDHSLYSLVNFLDEVDPDLIHAAAHSHSGRTALQAACYSMYHAPRLVEYLLNRGVDVNAEPARNGGYTALQAAALRGYIDIALRLIEAGANVNAPASRGEYGRTAIEAASEYGRGDMVKILINAGATGDTTRPDRFRRAVKFARRHHHYDIVELLEAHQELAPVEGPTEDSSEDETEKFLGRREGRLSLQAALHVNPVKPR